MKTYILDIEVYVDYFLVMLGDIAEIEPGLPYGHVAIFESYPGKPFEGSKLLSVLKESRLISFNGNNFDMPLLAAAIKGYDCAKLKAICDAIIVNGFKPWQIEKKFNFKTLQGLDHIDLIEVAPGTASLKIYGARLHCPKLQDLPIQPSASITPEDRQSLRTYCANDLKLTQALYEHLLPQIQLRERMGAEYGIDLRSKSDAQIAEAVICQEVSKLLGAEVVRPEVVAGTTFRYVPPANLKFETDSMLALVKTICELDLVVVLSGSVQMPKALSDMEIRIGAGCYKMGIGGLHSTEKSVAHVADANTLLIDRDVASYYPEIILRNNWAPAHMGDAFSKVFRNILDKRLAAKKSGDKVTADALKITVNGSFGKLGSKWSKLYAPHLMIQTTITGQLALLMLIERLEQFGIAVVSANTDGIVIKCKIEDELLMGLIVMDWEQRTGLATEATEYSALYSRDVNNYIAIKTDGSVKLKGAYALVSLQKNPTNEISVLAAVKYLKHGTPVEQTIAECKDIRKFVTVRQVKGGAVKDGKYLGKAVRWYYSVLGLGPIQYKVNGYTVAKSDGAVPLMEIPEEFPNDVDDDWYATEARSILEEVGAI